MSSNFYFEHVNRSCNVHKIDLQTKENPGAGNPWVSLEVGDEYWQVKAGRDRFALSEIELYLKMHYGVFFFVFWSSCMQSLLFMESKKLTALFHNCS
jgi:hypothetical protein